MKIRKRTAINVCLICLMIAGVIGIRYCNTHIYEIEVKYTEAINANKALSKKYTGNTEYLEINQKEPEKGNNEDTTINEEPPPGYNPLVVNFDGLNAECIFGTVAGWLVCDGTCINNPVVQCEDNSFYLHRLLDGTENLAGTLFTDCKCQPDFNSTNTIIYGHNMLNGTMFGELAKYINEPDFYEAHTDMNLYTPYKDYRVDIFSAFVTVTSNEALWQTEFADTQEYMDYISYLKRENRIPDCPDIEILPDDKIVSLITCAFDTDHSRTVVFGKLTEMS